MIQSNFFQHHHIRALLLMCVVLLSVRMQAQSSNARLTMEIRNATLESLVKRLENSTGFTFVYGEEVRLNSRISLQVKQLTISELLEQAFRDQPVEFSINGKHIVLRKREMPKKKERRRFTISGCVTEQGSAETLIGANVTEGRYATGTSTNTFGLYSLTLPEGEVSLTFSYLGFRPQQSRFVLTRDTVINIQLAGNVELQEVVITSQRKEAGIQSANTGSHNIPITQIRHTPSILGEADVLKTLQLMPGVQAGMEGFAGMYVRGGTPDQNLVMLDGIPVYNADHLMGVFSVFTPEAVKNVSLFKSSFPARYGGRLSSIVDVRTNDGDLHQYHGSLSIGSLTDKLHIEGPIRKGKTSFSLSGRFMPTTLIPNAVNTSESYGTHISTDKYNYYFYDLNAKLNHKFNDRSRLFLGFYRGKDHYHYYNDDKPTDYSSSPQQYYTSKARLNWGNLIGYARWNYVFSPKLFGNATVAYNQYHMTLQEDTENRKIQNGNTLEHQIYTSKFHSGIRDWSARMDFDYTPSTSHRVRFGSEFIHHLFSPGVSTAHEGNYGTSTTPSDTTYRTSINQAQRGFELSLYAEDDWELSDRLSLNWGGRLTLFHTQGKSYLSAQPRLSLRYDLGNGLAAKASYAHMAQYVHLLSSTPLSMPTDLWVPITRNIRPMYSNQYAAGLYYDGLSGWEFSVEGYYKQMRHILEYQDGVSFFGNSTYWEEKVEMGEGRCYGLEVMAQRTVGKTTGWISYTLSKSERRFKDGSISQGQWFPHKYDRRHSVNLCLNHKFSDRIDVGASWIFYTGGYMTVPERQTIVIKPDGSIGQENYISHRNNYQLPPTHRLNVGINFNRKTKHGMRTWNISIYNLYNAMNPNVVYTKQENIYENFAPGEIITQHTKTTIKKLTILPLIPSVTYTYRF